ncbi:MAG: response regulator, partial [Deltaproteobacteria bacterium]|nr:response regulator [Deltaproteobacteria bacterium]
GMRVLLLESNHRARETLNAQFQGWGMLVWTTTTFDGAMRTLRAPPYPDVTLIDLRSLGKDWRTRAYDVAKAATKVGSSVIATCSHRHEISDMIDAGIHVHVEKPVRRAKIIAALLKTLDRTQNRSLFPDDPERPSLPVPIPTNMQSNGMRILVAEDNVINRKVVQAHLEALGYEVDTVTDGEAALEALHRANPYAAVLMDGQMPKMDGYQAARALREREAQSGQRRVPIIALTAHAMAGDRRAAFAAGMDDYLSKPFTQRQLQMALTRWAARPDTRTSQFPPNALDTSITAQLLDLEQEEPGFLCSVIDSFFRTAEDNIARMKTAILSGDLQALRAAAHMVCGSSQQLGARRFGMTCRKLEELETTEGADALIVELEGDLEGAREALTGLADRALDAAS